jgi:ABC-type multidrug transport system ATPase subunit
MLSISHVTKKYGKMAANNDISFQVGDGQIAVLLGPNGAGKSTMIKCIAGLLRHEGEITVNGQSNKSIEAKKILGYVPEMPDL